MSGHSLWLHGCCSNHSIVPLRRWLDLASMLAQEFSEFSTESGGESEKVRGGQRATGSGTPQPTVETMLLLSVTKWSLDVCDSVHTTATQCSTVWHLPTLPSDSAFPSAVGFVRAHTQGHKTRHNVPAAASAAPPARHKSVHQHEGRGQPTWQTNRDCT